MAIDLNIVDWLSNWFAKKSDVVAKAQGNGNASKNLVTDTSGEVTLENKVSVGSGLSMSNTNQISHSNSVSGGAVNSFSPRMVKYDAQGHITETSNLYSTDIPLSSSDATKISAKISSIESDISTLQSLDFIVVTDTKPTASASTMNKLYVVSETIDNKNVVNVYYTKRTGATAVRRTRRSRRGFRLRTSARGCPSARRSSPAGACRP